MSVNVAPSILSADFSKIDAEVAKVVRAGAGFVHLDVMDGLFVPNRTFGPDLVKTIAPAAGSALKDTHLMVFDPHRLAPEFIEAGSDIVTFHYEAYETDDERWNCIRIIQRLGAKAGMSVKPATPSEVLDPFLSELSLVLVMSVEPGKGGQSFMPQSLDKIRYFRAKLDSFHSSAYLEVDGGINEETGALCVQAGADTLVAGSYIYGHDDYAERIRRLAAL